jgi:hypothetical protein
MRKPPKVKKEFSCVDKEIVLKDLYQVELKTLATYYRLRTSGTKNVYIDTKKCSCVFRTKVGKNVINDVKNQKNEFMCK